MKTYQIKEADGLKTARSELVSVYRRAVRLSERATVRVIQPLNDVINTLHGMLNELEEIIRSALDAAILSQPPSRPTKKPARKRRPKGK